MINGKMFISTSNSAKVLTVDSATLTPLLYPLPPRLPLTVRIICLQIEAVGSASCPLPVGSPKVRDCCVLGTMTETELQRGEEGVEEGLTGVAIGILVEIKVPLEPVLQH